MNYKLIIAVLFALSACQSTFAQSANNVIDEVIWVVGDEAILKSEVEEARVEAQMQGERFPGDPYCIIPEQLAVQKLFLHQAAIDSITVSDADVFTEVDRKIERYIQGFGSREKLEEYVGKSLNQFRNQQFELEKNSELMRQVQMNIIKNTKVTPVQVRNYFKDMPEDSLPFVPTTVEVQLFTRAPQISQAEIDRIKDDLREYTERVNTGKDKFSTLAVMYSEDGSSAKGGELGFMSRGELVPEFANVAFSLTDPNIVSKIVETEYGFHIIQLIEKRGDQVNVRHILRKPRATDDEVMDCVHFLDSVCDDIRRGKYTFEECLPYLSSDKDTRNNYGNMVYMDPQTRQTTSRFQMVNLPPEVARAVTGMQIGEISKPFTMINRQGKEVVAVVKLKNRINGHRATMKEDYQILQDTMLEKLNQDKLSAWIREKQKTTYIRINGDWRQCEFEYPGWIKE